MDNFDIPKSPLPPSNYVQIYFPHPECNTALGQNFSQDIREFKALSDKFIKWYFEVNTDIHNKTVVLEIILDSLFPQNYDLIIEDLDKVINKKLEGSSIYNLNSGYEGIRNFNLRVRKSIPMRTISLSVG